MTSKSSVPTKVIVHPLVLLSVVDHYYRLAKDTRRRVVGILLGEVTRTNSEVIVDVTNCYGVPFEEDESNPSVWFLDHMYHEQMNFMFKKVNVKENVVGWYSSGPRIRAADMAIHELVKKYCPNPVMVIVDVAPKEDFEIPAKSYISVEQIPEDEKKQPVMVFHHIASEVGAFEAEEVGIEHLLRDVKDTTISTLAHQVNKKINSLKSLVSNIDEIQTYLGNVVSGKLPINQQILGQLQDLFNLSPNMNVDALNKPFTLKTNDFMLSIYLASMIRSILALHSLLKNKKDLIEHEKTQSGEGEKKEAAKEAAKDDKKDSKENPSSESKDPKKKDH